jgi:7,8-dihydroneopterin aldolase/epimerase/oxygenase
MFIIHLHNLKFYSFHGVHEEEIIFGNEYEINVDVGFKEEERISALHQTIDYVSVYQLIRQQMDKPTPLLEMLAQVIAESIKAMDNRIISVVISIKKLNPPITSFIGNVGVTYSIPS